MVDSGSGDQGVCLTLFRIECLADEVQSWFD
jgi:hypothetical protein